MTIKAFIESLIKSLKHLSIKIRALETNECLTKISIDVMNEIHVNLEYSANTLSIIWKYVTVDKLFTIHADFTSSSHILLNRLENTSFLLS